MTSYRVSPNQHESYYYFTKGKAKFNKVFYDKVTYKIANETDSISMWETVTRDFQEFKSFTNNKERLLEWIEYRFNGASGFTQPSSTSKNASVHGISQWTKPRWLRVLDKHTKGQILTTVFQSFPHNKIKYNKDEYNIKHPTVKPIELFELLVKQTTNEGDIVFDPFLGSGTTALACLNTNRKFIGCELNEEYFNIIKERLDLATNPKP